MTLLVVAAVWLAACGEDSDPQPDPAADQTALVDNAELRSCLDSALSSGKAAGQDFSFGLETKPTQSFSLSPGYAEFAFDGLINVHVFPDYESAQVAIADVETNSDLLGAGGSHNVVWVSLSGQAKAAIPAALEEAITDCVNEAI